jgi:hypothetical protein
MSPHSTVTENHRGCEVKSMFSMYKPNLYFDKKVFLKHFICENSDKKGLKFYTEIFKENC